MLTQSLRPIDPFLLIVACMQQRSNVYDKTSPVGEWSQAGEWSVPTQTQQCTTSIRAAKHAFLGITQLNSVGLTSKQGCLGLGCRSCIQATGRTSPSCSPEPLLGVTCECMMHPADMMRRHHREARDTKKDAPM